MAFWIVFLFDFWSSIVSICAEFAVTLARNVIRSAIRLIIFYRFLDFTTHMKGFLLERPSDIVGAWTQRTSISFSSVVFLHLMNIYLSIDSKGACVLGFLPIQR
jgi:hypothetical protein